MIPKTVLLLIIVLILVAVLAIALVGCADKNPVTPGPASSHDPSQLLEVGAPAPGFTVRDEKGDWVRLADYQGKKNVVLVFYPGDDTPGCTKQLCAIRDDWSGFQGQDVAVFGVNPADAKSHQKFIQKYEFPFPILVDGDREVVDKYGCKGTLFVQRTVYGIDKMGTIVFAQRGTPSTQEILKAFQ